MNAVAARLPGDRLHLQHGPIDLILGADGPGREAAFLAATRRFEGMLGEIVSELPLLRSPSRAGGPVPEGAVGRRMDAAARPHASIFVTPMAAVAGAVADEVLAAMDDLDLSRAYVNNGGDIALRLEPGERYAAAMRRHDGAEIGRIEVAAGDRVRGIATSGRHGRSLSLGVADSVTVLARSAAEADVAATLIANAVDLPGHPSIRRAAASSVDLDNELGEREIVIAVGRLSEGEIDVALSAGQARAEAMREAGHIVAAALTLGDRTLVTGPHLTLGDADA